MTQPQPIHEIQPTPHLVAALGDALQAASAQPHEPQHGGGGGEPPDDDDDPYLINDDEVRQVARDLACGRDALLTVCRLLRDADTAAATAREANGLGVLLEGPLTRLDLAMEGLLALAHGLRVEGLRGLV